MDDSKKISFATEAHRAANSRYAQKQLVGAQEDRDGKTIKQNLKALEDEEKRYAKMYGQSFMSEAIYGERMEVYGNAAKPSLS